MLALPPRGALSDVKIQGNPGFKDRWGKDDIRVFPKWKGNSLNSSNLINRYSRSRGEFKGPVSHNCFAGSVVVQSLLL